MKKELTELKEIVKSSSLGNCSSGDEIQYNSQYISNEKLIPSEDLFVLKGSLNGVRATVLKDDGCSTNLVSKRFVDRNRQLFKLKKAEVPIMHSKEDSEEMATEIVLNGTLKIGFHTYTSNWVVGDSRYDVLLGMPWHVATDPKIDYVNHKIVVGNESISTSHA